MYIFVKSCTLIKSRLHKENDKMSILFHVQLHSIHHICHFHSETGSYVSHIVNVLHSDFKKIILCIIISFAFLDFWRFKVLQDGYLSRYCRTRLSVGRRYYKHPSLFFCKFKCHMKLNPSPWSSTFMRQFKQFIYLFIIYSFIHKHSL